MKKLLAILLLAVTVPLCFSACGVEKTKITDGDTENNEMISVNSLYKTFTEAYLLKYTEGDYEYDENKAIVKHILDGDLRSFEYDVDNNKVNCSEFTEDGSIRQTIEYNKNANEIKLLIYDDNGNKYRLSEYVYDENELLLEIVHSDPYDGYIIRREKYEYDENGTLVKITSYDDNGNLSGWDEFDSDGNWIFFAQISESHNYKGETTWVEEVFEPTQGLLRKRTIYDNDRNILDWTDYVYDENSKPVKETTYNAEGEITCWTEYDENGTPKEFPVKTYIFDDMRTEIIGWEEFEYDDNNNQIKLTRYEADGSIELYVETEYEDGICIKKTRYDSNGKIHLWAIPEYDENGNISFYTVYGSGDKELYVGEIDGYLMPANDPFFGE